MHQDMAGSGDVFFRRGGWMASTRTVGGIQQSYPTLALVDITLALA